ncbi:MAG: tetratricopeptide repeat protein, partial [Nitrospinae bacterium]|nr:tetratricopeptide repeat protein [Nitrospinota bacterium]
MLSNHCASQSDTVTYASEGYFRLGVSLMKLKDYHSAEEPLRKAVELSPDSELANDT